MTNFVPRSSPSSGTNSATSECDCIVDQVVNMGNRVHVHCQAPELGSVPFAFFALPLDSPLVDTFTIMGQAVAMENIKRNQVSYLRDFCAYTAGSAIGCAKGQPENGIIYPHPAPYKLHIWYDAADTSGVSFGCQADSCRKPQAFGFLGQMY